MAAPAVCFFSCDTTHSDACKAMNAGESAANGFGTHFCPAVYCTLRGFDTVDGCILPNPAVANYLDKHPTRVITVGPFTFVVMTSEEYKENNGSSEHHFTFTDGKKVVVLIEAPMNHHMKCAVSVARSEYLKKHPEPFPSCKPSCQEELKARKLQSDAYYEAVKKAACSILG